MSKLNIRAKALKPKRALKQDVKNWKQQQEKYQNILKDQSDEAIKGSKYLSEKQQDLVNITNKIDKWETAIGSSSKTTKVKDYDVKDYEVKKYEDGGEFIDPPIEQI